MEKRGCTLQGGSPGAVDGAVGVDAGVGLAVSRATLYPIRESRGEGVGEGPGGLGWRKAYGYKQ